MATTEKQDRQTVISEQKSFLSRPIKVLGSKFLYKNSSDCSSNFFKERPSEDDAKTILKFVMSK
jgi:hypothetical protein